MSGRVNTGNKMLYVVGIINSLIKFRAVNKLWKTFQQKLVQPMRAAAFKPLSAASLSTDCDCNAEEVKKVTIIPGDGIGPELMHAMKVR